MTSEAETMVERIARALAKANAVDPNAKDYLGSPVWIGWKPSARAVLTALLDPTEDMLDEGCDTLNCEVSWRGKEAEAAFPCHLRPVFRAMIQAALQPGSEAQ